MITEKSCISQLTWGIRSHCSGALVGRKCLDEAPFTWNDTGMEKMTSKKEKKEKSKQELCCSRSPGEEEKQRLGVESNQHSWQWDRGKWKINGSVERVRIVTCVSGLYRFWRIWPKQTHRGSPLYVWIVCQSGAKEEKKLLHFPG